MSPRSHYSNRPSTIFLFVFLFLHLSASATVSCLDLFNFKPVLPNLGSSAERFDASSGNMRHGLPTSIIATGYRKGFQWAYQELNSFLRTELKKGDQIIIEYVKSNLNDYPIDYPRFYSQLTVQSEISIHSDGVSFLAFDPSKNRSRWIVLKFDDPLISQIHVKTFNANLRNGLVAVDPSDRNVEASGFAKTFSDRGYKWLGPLNRLTTAEFQQQIIRLYEALRPGDELVFINQSGQIQKLIVLDLHDGILRFMDVQTATTSYYSGSWFLHESSKLRLTPALLSQMMLPGQILIGQVPEKTQPNRSQDWTSDVERIREGFESANRAFMAGNLTEKLMSDPKGTVASIHMSQIYAVDNLWDVARIHLQNIKAIRGLSGKARYVQNRISYDQISRLDLSGENTSRLLSASPLIGKNLEIDVYLGRDGIGEKKSIRVERSLTNNNFELVLQVSSREEGTALYAHLLETAFGRAIDDARHIAHLDDIRMDMTAYKTSNTLQSLEKSSDGRPLFRGRVTTAKRQSVSEFELRIEFQDGFRIGYTESHLLMGLLWAHHLRETP